MGTFARTDKDLKKSSPCVYACVCVYVCCSDCEEGDVDIKVAVLFVVWSRSDGLRSRGARSEVTRQLLGAGVLPPDVQHED